MRFQKHLPQELKIFKEKKIIKTTVRKSCGDLQNYIQYDHWYSWFYLITLALF